MGRGTWFAGVSAKEKFCRFVLLVGNLIIGG